MCVSLCVRAHGVRIFVSAKRSEASVEDIIGFGRPKLCRINAARSGDTVDSSPTVACHFELLTRPGGRPPQYDGWFRAPLSLSTVRRRSRKSIVRASGQSQTSDGSSGEITVPSIRMQSWSTAPDRCLERCSE